MSVRFVPLSLEKPKALLQVKGEILIERQIRQLQEAGIQEIVIVVGYMKEQFQYLKKKYGVILVENPDYKKKNNHSSLYAARKYLKNTYICSGDNYFTQNVFREETQESYYASVYADGSTDEWCLETEENGRIKKVEIGGKDSWIMKGHAFFNADFSRQLLPFLECAYFREEDAGKFWEEIYMEHIDEMDLFIRRYEYHTIEEFDSIEELRQFDEKYWNQTGSSVMDQLSQKLRCREAELSIVCPVKEEGEVTGFLFWCRGREYKYFIRNQRLQEAQNGE